MHSNRARLIKQSSSRVPSIRCSVHHIGTSVSAAVARNAALAASEYAYFHFERQGVVADIQIWELDSGEICNPGPTRLSGCRADNCAL